MPKFVMGIALGLSLLSAPLLAQNIALPAAIAITLEGPRIPGGLLRGQAPPGCKITANGQSITLNAQGEFLIGIGLYEDALILNLQGAGKQQAETITLPIWPRHFGVQRIDGLPSQQVTPDPEVAQRIRREQKRITTLRSQNQPGPELQLPFISPAQGTITGVYGTRRILNGKERAPHNGLDIAAPTGTPIIAPHNGTVRLVADFALSGITILIDHGYGLQSAFIHLSSAQVQVGQKIKRGEIIGHIGTSGRTTGPHLHWSLTWLQKRLDPALLLRPQP